MEHKFSEVAEISGFEKMDEKLAPYLAAGWVIFGSWIRDFGIPGTRLETIRFLVGRPAGADDPTLYMPEPDPEGLTPP